MSMVRLENRSRNVYHFPVLGPDKDWQGNDIQVLRTTVILGEENDRRLPIDEEGGDTRLVNHEFTLPEDAFEAEWAPKTEREIRQPAPVLRMTTEQYEGLGERNLAFIDQLVANKIVERKIGKNV